MTPPWADTLPGIFPRVRHLDDGDSTDPSEITNDTVDTSPSSVSVFSSHGILQPCASTAARWFGNRQEARLFMHYVHELSPWLDICDRHRHFGVELPKAAARSPLLNASILAFASCQLSSIRQGPTVDSAKYNCEALQILIPMLDGPIETLDAEVLAAICLLRLCEEMQDDDSAAHLSGSSRLLNSPLSLMARRGLGEAASWVALRQDMYICLTTQRPMSIHLETFQQSASFVELDPESLANRAVFLCAQVLVWAIPPDGDAHAGAASRHDAGAWELLRQAVGKWTELVPRESSLLWSRRSPGGGHGEPSSRSSSFPTLWMTHPAYITGYQHVYLAKTILAIYDPRQNVPGPGSLLRRRETDETVLENLRVVVGLATSSPHVVNACFTACHALQVCGGLLAEGREREGAVEFLTSFEKTTGWRTGHVVDQLRSQWEASASLTGALPGGLLEE